MINKGILIDRQFDAELFADNLRLLREGKGLTQAELGSLCGISENAIRNYELGHCFPKTATLNALANALDISIKVLNQTICQPLIDTSRFPSRTIRRFLMDFMQLVTYQRPVAFQMLNCS